MPSGYQVFNPDGEIVIDTTTRTGRVLAMIPVSGVPSVIVTGSYTKPVDIAGSLFGYVSAVLGLIMSSIMSLWRQMATH